MKTEVFMQLSESEKKAIAQSFRKGKKSGRRCGSAKKSMPLSESEKRQSLRNFENAKKGWRSRSSGTNSPELVHCDVRDRFPTGASLFFVLLRIILRVYRDFLAFRYFRQISGSDAALEEGLAYVVSCHVIISVFVTDDTNDIAVIHFADNCHVI